MDDRWMQTEIDEVRERARRRYRWRYLVTFLPSYFALTVLLDAFGPEGESTGDVVALLITMVIVASLFLVVTRRRRAWWPEPPLVAGLPRQQRRQVGRDLRRGQLNSHPLLAEIERLSARRQYTAGRLTVWVAGVLCPVTIVAAVATGNGLETRILYWAAAALLLAAAIYQSLLNRGLRALAR